MTHEPDHEDRMFAGMLGACVLCGLGLLVWALTNEEGRLLIAGIITIVLGIYLLGTVMVKVDNWLTERQHDW